jgi:hypothetical protein
MEGRDRSLIEWYLAGGTEGNYEKSVRTAGLRVEI